MQLPKFEEAARGGEEVTDPVDLPELCEVPWGSVECWGRLDVYDEVAVGNTETAQLNADIARDSDAAYDFILSGAKRQQSIGLIREEMLERERRDHLIDNIQHWVMIGVLAVGLIL